MKQLVLAARLVFGAWMLASGLNHFFVHFYPLPAGHEPLAVQLMTALVHSQLLDVAMGIQLVAGALILTGLLVPVALCVVMPVSTCAAYWTVVLEHEPIGAVLALVAVALNGLLLLAYIDYYRDMLQRHALALGEAGDRMNYEALFVDPRGRTSRGQYIGALIALLAAFVFYYLLVFGPSGRIGMLVMLYPAVVLHARRLHDMGRPVWLLAAPVAVIVAAFWLRTTSPGTEAQSNVALAAFAVCGVFALWCLISKARTEAA